MANAATDLTGSGPDAAAGTGDAPDAAPGPSVDDQVAQLLREAPIVVESDTAEKATPYRKPGVVTDDAPVTDEERVDSLDEPNDQPPAAATLDEPSPDDKPWSYHAARRERLKAQREREEASKIRAEAEALRERYSSRAPVLDAIEESISKGDFRGAVEQMVRKWGVSPDDVLAAIAGQRQPSELTSEMRIKRLEESLAKRDEDMAKEREAYKAQYEAQRTQQRVDYNVQRILSVQEQETLRTRWPWAAALEPDILREAASTLVADAVSMTPEGQQFPLDPIMDVLNKYAQRMGEGFRKATWLERRQERLETEQAQEQPKRRARAAERVVSSEDAADRGGAGELTEAEIDKEFNRLARELGREYNS